MCNYHANSLAYETSFNSISCSADFVVMTETWNSYDTLNFCTLDGYTGIHTHRTITRGGGVSVFFKNSFTAKNVPNLSVCNSTIETCVVRIFVQGGWVPLDSGCISTAHGFDRKFYFVLGINSE